MESSFQPGPGSVAGPERGSDGEVAPHGQAHARLEEVPASLRVLLEGEEIAASSRALRLIEADGARALYLPREDVRPDVLRPVGGATWSPAKGRAEFFDLVAGGRRARRAAWILPRPEGLLERLRGRVGFREGKVEIQGRAELRRRA